MINIFGMFFNPEIFFELVSSLQKKKISLPNCSQAQELSYPCSVVHILVDIRDVDNWSA